MKINNKEFREWGEEELQVLLHNEIYRENSFIDYKVNFAPLECADKKQKKEKQDEFRNDVCSFANADGGYIFYGIGEDSGMAGTLVGVLISNLDRFELDRRNELQTIQPVMPEVEFSFIPIREEGKEDNILTKENKYVVVLHVYKGFYKPYITEKQEGTFHAWIRHGNRKQAMTYAEMRNDFLNAATLSEKIKKFRKERLKEHTDERKEPFAIAQIIPATFGNQLDYFPMFELNRQGKLNFNEFFNDMIFECAVPNVDGVYFPDYSGKYDYEKLQIFNNGSVELKMDLMVKERKSYPGYQLETERYLITIDFINALKKLISGTAEMYRKLERSTTMYVCVTIVGCKGMWNYIPDAYGENLSTKVDRNQILCMPVEIRDILDEEQVKNGIENCIRMVKYSLGIRK